MTSEDKKCFFKNEILNYCDNWNNIIYHVNFSKNKTKGFRMITKNNPKTYNSTIELIYYHHTHNHKGILVCYCPWCGEPLHKEFENDK